MADDSKKTTHTQREEIYQDIIKGVDYHLVKVEPSKIDKDGLSKCIKEALEEIINHFPNEKYLYDGKAKFGVENPNLETLVKADALVKGVGAASIIAKVHKDRLMEEHAKTYPQYGFETNSGYGTPKHIQAIIDYGYTPIHRRSYKIKQLQDKEIKDSTDLLF